MDRPDKIILNPVDLTEEPRVFDGELSIHLLDLDSEDSINPADPIEYQLKAQLLADQLLVMGAIGFECEITCSKCAEFYSTKVIDSSFVRHLPLISTTEGVDITDDVREALLLQIPHFPLCSDSCKGLCTFCGVNLNRSSCECEAPAKDDRWSTLDGLDVDEKE